MKAIIAAYWLGSMHERPNNRKEIQKLLGCSQATAFRWLKFIREFEAPVPKDDHRAVAAFNEWVRHA